MIAQVLKSFPMITSLAMVSWLYPAIIFISGTQVSDKANKVYKIYIHVSDKLDFNFDKIAGQEKKCESGYTKLRLRNSAINNPKRLELEIKMDEAFFNRETLKASISCVVERLKHKQIIETNRQIKDFGSTTCGTYVRNM